MKSKLSILMLVVAGSVALTGCGSKEAGPVATDPTAAAPAADQAAAEQQQEQPVQVTQTVDPAAAMAESDRALKQRDYENAAAALLRIQMANSQLTEQQGFDHVNRMRDLSKQIADAALSGDPKAQRAAELMRRAHQYRTAR